MAKCLANVPTVPDVLEESLAVTVNAFAVTVNAFVMHSYHPQHVLQVQDNQRWLPV